MAEWIYDPLPPSGAKSGDSPIDKLLASDGDKNLTGIGIYVREGGQNSTDQIPSVAGASAKLVFRIIELTGNAKKDFLDALAWKQLSDHLGGVSETTGVGAQRIKESKDRISDPGKPLRLLSISDYGTNGLIGGEADDAQNFFLLCKAEFLTSSDPKRIGSFGLGKGVYYRFSGAGTVLFSSVVEHPDTGLLSLRLFGRSICASHSTTDGDEWEGKGFFGDPNVGKLRAESVWEDKSLADRLMVGRDIDPDNKGTTILSLDFNDKEVDEQSGLEETAGQIRENVKKWFWPGMTQIDGHTNLKVELEIIENGAVTLHQEIKPDEEWSEYSDVLVSNSNAASITKIGDVASESVAFEFPKKKSDAPGKQSAEVMIKVKGGSSKYLASEVRDHIATLRKNMMVNAYLPVSEDILEDIPTFAVAMAGFARGAETSDELLHEFLRDSEPPTHDHWRYRDTVTHKYNRGAVAAQQRLDGLIKATARKLILGEPKTEGAATLLAKRFKFGPSGDSQTKRKIHTKVVSDSINSGGTGWDLRLELSNSEDIADWDHKIRFGVKGIQRGGLSIHSAIPRSNGLTIPSVGIDDLGIKIVGDDRCEIDVSLEIDQSKFIKADIYQLVLEVIV